MTSPDSRALVLLVDDEDIVHRLVNRAIGWHVDVVCAHTGHEARGALHSEPVDLVLLDLNLPDITGFELLSFIMSLDSPPPVIVFSSDDAPATHAEAVRRGAVDFVHKTAESYDTLVDRIRRVLSSRASP